MTDIVDADVVFTGAPYIIYTQFQLDHSFKTYLEGTIQSEHVLRMVSQPTRYRNSFEVLRGTESQLVDFTGANNQIFFIYHVSVQQERSRQKYLQHLQH